MDKNGRRFWQLTTVTPRVGGVLHPQFSPAGDKLLWSERVSTKGPLGSWGEWALRVADFRITANGVRIENERLLQPGVQQRMYESHGFSPDGEQILFSGNLDRGQDETGADIYLFNLRTNKLTNLTQTLTEWDEHAHFSPDGRTILWMSSKDLPHWRKAGEVLTDYWLMNADGSNKRRITYFNTQGHDEYTAGGLSAADAAWSPDGTRIAGYLLTDVKKGGKIVMIDMR
jgi:Tol biopolymer transport system component